MPIARALEHPGSVIAPFVPGPVVPGVGEYYELYNDQSVPTLLDDVSRADIHHLLFRAAHPRSPQKLAKT